MDSVFGIGYLVFTVLMFLLYIAVLGWVYSDAEDKGHMGCLWVLLCLILGPLGLIVYLLFFHGFPATDHHQSPKREDDLKFRSMYRGDANGVPLKQGESGQWGTKVPMKSLGKADETFQDEELERLIRNEKLSEARVYLKDMQSLAREMNDSRGLVNYAKYESIIGRAATKAGKNDLRTSY